MQYEAKSKLILLPASRPTLIFSPNPNLFIDISKKYLSPAFLNNLQGWSEERSSIYTNWLPMS